MRYSCKTLFDISATGITGHYRPTRGEFHDATGKYINSLESWNFSRNQQRNWETLQQLISLRTQIINFTAPVHTENYWIFDFEVETTAVYHDGTDPVGVLKNDAEGVPMVVNLENSTAVSKIIVTHGPGQNIWFETIE